MEVRVRVKVRVKVRVRVTCAAHSTQLGCFCLPLAPWPQEVRCGLDPRLQCISTPSFSAQGTPRSPPALPPEGISEARACRGEDVCCGPAAAQMHKDQPNHEPPLPVSPIAAVPDTNPQQPGRESRDVSPPHCTSRERLRDLPKVTQEACGRTRI